MVKNKNFGSVSAKLLCSFALISLVGCSSTPPSLAQPYGQLLSKKETCFEQSKKGSDSFPDSPWLLSLNDGDKQKALSYLAQYAYNSCISNEVALVKESVSQQSKDIQLFFNEYVGLHEFEQEPPAGLSSSELFDLQKRIKMPFIANEVYLKLK